MCVYTFFAYHSKYKDLFIYQDNAAVLYVQNLIMTIFINL